MRSRALDQMERERVGAGSVLISTSADLRYVGQGFSLEARFTVQELEAWQNLDVLAGRFHQLHQAAYGYSDERAPTEVVNLRLVAIGRLARPELTRPAEGSSHASAALKGSRQVYLDGNYEAVRVYERSKLRSSNRLEGPALIEQLDSTTLIWPGQHAEADEAG